MIGAARRWFRRNRKGLAIGAGVLGAGYLAGQYVLSKIVEARERMSSDRIARENLRRRFEQNQTDCTYTVLALLPTATENIIDALPVEELTKELQKKRAERLARLNAGETAGSDMTSVAPSITEEDRKSLSSFQSEAYLHTSQLGESVNAEGKTQPKRNKTQLWNEVKITSITRSFTLIYTLSLLTIFTRIQLNLLGRRNYLSSVISLANPPADSTISLEDHDDELTQTLGDDFETNRRYLAFSWWLLHRGWQELVARVQPAVEEVFGPLNPREDITLAKLSDLTMQIRRKVEGNTEEERRPSRLESNVFQSADDLESVLFRSTKWLACLLPPTEEEEYVLRESGVEGVADPSSSQTALKLRHLLDETADLIDSPSFSLVLTLLNNEGFSTLVDSKCATEAFQASESAAMTVPQSFDSMATVVPAPSERRTKLANLLAVMARQAHIIGNGAHPSNEYLVAMDQNVRELEAFSAVIYSSNFELELLGATTNPTVKAEETADFEPVSSSFADILVEKTGPSTSLDSSNDGIMDDAIDGQGPGLTDIEEQIAADSISDSAFEKAWGKAVEDGPDTSETATGATN
ncbi:hypothetical protein N7539_000150 [Penicillium diatomitis]|uniref:Peroxin-3 n=1 Tax=Penicillium diatomitis TaxID=2819901 RepID=A0A9W9XML2_9EURO|nr:uncharacterized protein N7539_000150 [Penicillium diatomitis]KAJ5495034.1 hypothetical protein N7539_000150 [Penicillium diatomitis]